MNLTLISKPTFYPVDLDELATFLRIEEHEEMPLIQSLLETAVDKSESLTWQRFASQQWRLDLPRFEQRQRIPYPPLISVDSVQYYNDQNVLTTLPAEEYEVYKQNKVAFIKSAYGYSAPSSYPREDAVQITFTCGHASEDLIPEGIKNTIKSIIWHMYNNKEQKLTDEYFKCALGPYMLSGF